MADDPFSSEFGQSLPDLDPVQYDHWRDWSYNLQIGNVELPNVKNSSRFGNAMFIVGRGTIARLREGNDKNGVPFIIHTDEKTDEQVLSTSSPEDRKRAFVDSVFSNARGWTSGETKEERQFYPAAVLAMGSAILESIPQDIKTLLYEEAERSNVPYFNKVAFKQSLSELSDEKAKTLMDYLKFSQTQMVNNETYFVKTGLKKPPAIGSAPIMLDGEELEFEGQNYGGEAVPEQEEYLLVPLLAANSRSRQDMIEQAKEVARQVFGTSEEKLRISNPPDWWIKDEHSDGISSKDVLIYIPHGPLSSTDKLPKVYDEIIKSSSLKNGWFVVQIEKQNGPWILSGMITRLTG